MRPPSDHNPAFPASLWDSQEFFHLLVPLSSQMLNDEENPWYRSDPVPKEVCRVVPSPDSTLQTPNNARGVAHTNQPRLPPPLVVLLPDLLHALAGWPPRTPHLAGCPGRSSRPRKAPFSLSAARPLPAPPCARLLPNQGRPVQFLRPCPFPSGGGEGLADTDTVAMWVQPEAPSSPTRPLASGGNTKENWGGLRRSTSSSHTPARSSLLAAPCPSL